MLLIAGWPWGLKLDFRVYSKLVSLSAAAAASLRALGLSTLAAERVIRRFEQHDKEMLVRSQQVRHDQKAFINTEEEGRRSLEALLAADQAEAAASEKSE